MGSPCRPAGCHLEYGDRHPPGSVGELEQNLSRADTKSSPRASSAPGPGSSLDAKAPMGGPPLCLGHDRPLEGPGDSE